MAQCDFSWFKIGTFFGALLLVVLLFVMLGFGISNIVNGEKFYGCACISAGIICGSIAVWLYKNYQKRSGD